MMEYSAASVKFLLWFVETRETLKLLKDHDIEEVRNIVVDNNVYQQKSQGRLISEFGCIKKRIMTMPEDMKQFMMKTDINSAKIVALVAAMAADRLLFEFVYEIYREEVRLGGEELKESDINIFFKNKIDQSDVIAGWTDATIKKLKQTYTKFLIEAGLVSKISTSEKRIKKPYIDPELRNILVNHNMELYLYALTGER